MQHRIGFPEVVSQANSGTGLHARIYKIEIIVTKSEVHAQVADRREVVLNIGAGLPTEQPSSEAGEDVWIAAAVKEEAFVFAKAI